MNLLHVIYLESTQTKMKTIGKLTIEQKLQGIILAIIGFVALIDYVIL
jgi:hypothetical protein